jgi:hypothetical protein
VSSRQEEKERRRQERLAKEAEAAAAGRRRRIIGIASGGVLVVAIVVAIVVAVAGGGGSDDSADQPKSKPKSTVPIPAAATTNLDAAVKAAGCTARTFVPGPNDRNHVTGKVNYKQNPPVFGPHNPVPAHDGDYAGNTPPSTEQLVHPLEHGRVVIWYRPTLPAHRVAQLETLFAEPIVGGAPEGYKQLLVTRANMPFEVAASSWGQQLGCPKFNDKVFDAIRAFRKAYVDHGPEQVPFPE